MQKSIRDFLTNCRFREELSEIEYVFTDKQLTIKSNPVSPHQFELYKENSLDYLKTKPTLYSEDLLVKLESDKIQLVEKFSKRSRGTLIKIED